MDKLFKFEKLFENVTITPRQYVRGSPYSAGLLEDNFFSTKPKMIRPCNNRGARIRTDIVIKPPPGRT